LEQILRMRNNVSVIIAAYNADKTIIKCVESAIAQKNVIVEVIVIDDCSSDNTYQTAIALQNKHPNITVLKNKKNSGPSFSRNQGILLAKYEWIAILDADDFVNENRLHLMIEYAVKNNADICFDNINIITSHKNNHITENELITKNHKHLLEGYWNIQMYTDLNKPYISSVLIGFLKPIFKKQFITKNKITYNERVRNSEDYLFVLEALIKNAKVVYLDQTMYQYTVLNTSLSGKFDLIAHNKMVLEENMLFNRYEGCLNEIEKKAVIKHIQAFTLAGETNLIFKAIAEKSPKSIILLLWKYKSNIHIHLKRIFHSIFRRIFGIDYRGK